MPRAKGIWGEMWNVCDRCGFLHPISLLVKQKGQMICTCHGCYDDLSVERRPSQIAAVLADGKEGINPKADKQVETDSYELEF